jgi:hypothetical protein
MNINWMIGLVAVPKFQDNKEERKIYCWLRNIILVVVYTKLNLLQKIVCIRQNKYSFIKDDHFKRFFGDITFTSFPYERISLMKS